jgi:hypothetical protein
VMSLASITSVTRNDLSSLRCAERRTCSKTLRPGATRVCRPFARIQRPPEVSVSLAVPGPTNIAQLNAPTAYTSVSVTGSALEDDEFSRKP